MNRTTRILSVLVIALCTALVRAEMPQPPGQGPGVQLRRLGENLSKLDLTPEQQEKSKAVIEEMMTRLHELKANAKPDDRPMAKAGEIFADARGKLAEILTPEQQAKLRDLVQQQRSEQAKRESDAAKPRPAEPEKKPEPTAVSKAEPAAKPEPKKAESKAPEPKIENPAKQGPASPGALDRMTAVDVGAQAPDFTLKTTGDKVQALSAYKGKVVVLVFGSYTCPVFREKLAALEKLNRDEQLKASFLIVYTREAHALGEWEVERNKNENIQIEQPKTDAERRDLAKQTVSTLKITVSVVVDSIDDTVAKAYGLAPNGAVVIGRDGKIAGKQMWFEPTALRGMIDSAAMVHNPTN